MEDTYNVTCAGLYTTKSLISRKFCVKMSGAFSRPSGGSTPPNLRFLKKNVETF